MDPSLAVPLQDFDFALLDSQSFKEDSVREEIIHPLLNALGYSVSGRNRIIRSEGLEHPFLTVGSKDRPVTLIPDYPLTVDGNFTFVLDAKAPAEQIKTGHNVEQVYSYAVHPEIRVDLFALCNGREFILFDVHQQEPVLYFHVSEASSADLRFRSAAFHPESSLSSSNPRAPINGQGCAIVAKPNRSYRNGRRRRHTAIIYAPAPRGARPKSRGPGEAGSADLLFRSAALSGNEKRLFH